MPTREEWLIERRTGCGGTDAARICGISPYGSKLDVYFEKMGQAPPKEETVAMRAGSLQEPVLAQLYLEQTETPIQRNGFTIYRHPDNPIFLCTPDAWATEDSDLLVEFKTANARQARFWGDEGTDQVPQHYLMQCIWNCFVMQRLRCDLAAFVGGEFRLYRIHYDHDLVQMMRDEVETFWQEHIIPGTPPELDASNAVEEYLNYNYPTHTDLIIPANLEVDGLVQMYVDARKDRFAAQEKEEEAKHKLQHLIGENEGIAGEWWTATWKKTKDQNVTDWKKLALALNPTDQMLKDYTETRLGYRRFRLVVEE